MIICFRGEYFLTDYIYKLGNYDGGLMDTGFIFEGYVDNYNCSSKELTGTDIIANRQYSRYTNDGKKVYEFAIIPNMGFLGSPDLLVKNCELKLSFDRAPANIAVLKVGDPAEELKDHLEIKDCFAMTDYISSSAIRDYFSVIETQPFVYHYDDVDVIIKNIPLGETDIRFDTLRGGNTPSYMFVGVIPQKSLMGDLEQSSTGFQANMVSEMNITYNGNSVNGYPIEIAHNSYVYPMLKYLDVTGQLYNQTCGQTLTGPEFEYNFIWSHKFEAEPSPEGWVGVNFKFNELNKKADGEIEPMCLVAWIMFESVFTIDNYLQVDKIN